MNSIDIDVFDFKDFDENDFSEALSDLQKFSVNNDELDLNYHPTEE
jgi:hypothetical protein